MRKLLFMFICLICVLSFSGLGINETNETETNLDWFSIELGQPKRVFNINLSSEKEAVTGLLEIKNPNGFPVQVTIDSYGDLKFKNISPNRFELWYLGANVVKYTINIPKKSGVYEGGLNIKFNQVNQTRVVALNSVIQLNVYSDKNKWDTISTILLYLAIGLAVFGIVYNIIRKKKGGGMDEFIDDSLKK